MPGDRKVAVAPSPEQDPARPQTGYPAFRKSRREQRVGAYVAHALQNGREIHQIAQAKRTSALRGAARETHAASIRRAEARNDTAFRTKTASRPNRTATAPPMPAPAARAERPRDGSQRVGRQHVLFRHNIGDRRDCAPARRTPRPPSRTAAAGRPARPSWGAHGQHAEHDEEARDIRADHDRLAASRSLITPAVGATSVCGSTCRTTARPTASALPPVN